jgi:hypothetical protein
MTKGTIAYMLHHSSMHGVAVGSCPLYSSDKIEQHTVFAHTAQEHTLTNDLVDGFMKSACWNDPEKDQAFFDCVFIHPEDAG